MREIRGGQLWCAIPALRAAQIFRVRVIKLKNSEWRRFYMSDRLDVVF